MRLSNQQIAVCMVGESRTFEHCSESIKNFFSTKGDNNYHFFGHTWNTNTFKVMKNAKIIVDEDTIEDLDDLTNRLNQHFDFKKLIVEKNVYRPYPWANVFYSTMRSNFLKQKYESDNNMMFDIVVKARFDTCYPSNIKFEDILPSPVQEKTLYSNFGLMRGEFFLPNPDDVFYFGTSLTMDLVDSLYNSLSTGAFDKMLNISHDNNAYHRVGPGILIHKWSTIKNILPMHIDIPYAVYRKQAIGLNYNTNWDVISKISSLVY